MTYATDMARGERRKRNWYDSFLDVGVWILFVLLFIIIRALSG